MEFERRLASPPAGLTSLIAELAPLGCAMTLQTYLENLRWLARRWSEHDALPLADFIDLLGMAFAPKARDEAPRGPVVYTFLAWERRITQQIRDLVQLRKSGALDRIHRRACVAAPDGNRWHNFDPGSYLECAMTGAFGGWQAKHAAAGALRNVTWRELGHFLSAGQGHGRGAPLLVPRRWS